MDIIDNLRPRYESCHRQNTTWSCSVVTFVSLSPPSLSYYEPGVSQQTQKTRVILFNNNLEMNVSFLYMQQEINKWSLAPSSSLPAFRTPMWKSTLRSSLSTTCWLKQTRLVFLSNWLIVYWLDYLSFVLINLYW